MREQLVELLSGGGAHVGFETAVENIPPSLRGGIPEGQPYTPWRLLEHIRRAQNDILRFSTEPGYESPPWPDGFWPNGDAPPSDDAWNESIRAFGRTQFG